MVSLPLRLLTLEATLKPGVAWPPHCVEPPSKDGPRRGAGNLFCYVRQCSILIFTLRMEAPALPSAASKAGTGFLRSPVSPGLGEFCCKLSKISKHSPLIRLVKESDSRIKVVPRAPANHASLPNRCSWAHGRRGHAWPTLGRAAGTDAKAAGGDVQLQTAWAPKAKRCRLWTYAPVMLMDLYPSKCSLFHVPCTKPLESRMCPII